jgi:protein-S-isoprenylcysteine O-methyltransferase Ste14
VAWVRHPSWTAAALMILGIGLALGNWAGLLALAVAVTIAYGYRAYMRRTKRFVPFVV